MVGVNERKLAGDGSRKVRLDFILAEISTESGVY